MPWQETFNDVLGTGLFGGSLFGDWLRFLSTNRFVVHPKFLPRALGITGVCLSNSVSRWIEEWKYGREYRQQRIQEPLFILGHWRSGTTHLQNLLSHDNRFAFPNLYQVMCPQTFLISETVGSSVMRLLAPKTRGIDNVVIAPEVPNEDEFALAAMTSFSPYTAMAFSRNQQHYDRFLTLRDASPAELARWKEALVTFLQKLTWKYRRPLILKSPTHTCRIRLLLELFPDAKFIHIRRHPFEVFRSMKKMLAVALRFWQLQKGDRIDWQERTIRQYREMYEVYFEEQGLIPQGRLHELSFEDLDADPIGQVRAIYQSLRLPDFAVFEPALRQYVDSLTGYQKNPAVTLPLDIRCRLLNEWRICLDSWGYSDGARQVTDASHSA